MSARIGVNELRSAAEEVNKVELFLVVVSLVALVTVLVALVTVLVAPVTFLVIVALPVATASVAR